MGFYSAGSTGAANSGGGGGGGLSLSEVQAQIAPWARPGNVSELPPAKLPAATESERGALVPTARDKLIHIEPQATADQTAQEIADLIDALLGSGAWRQGGAGGSREIQQIGPAHALPNSSAHPAVLYTFTADPLDYDEIYIVFSSGATTGARSVSSPIDTRELEALTALVISPSSDIRNATSRVVASFGRGDITNGALNFSLVRTGQAMQWFIGTGAGASSFGSHSILGAFGIRGAAGTATPGSAEGALRYDQEQTLTGPQQQRVQTNAGGPFALATSAAGEAPEARWTAHGQRVIFIAGTQFSQVLRLEAPTGGHIQLNGNGGTGYHPQPVLDNEFRLSFSGGSSFIADMGARLPDRFVLAFRLDPRVIPTTENQTLVHQGNLFWLGFQNDRLHLTFGQAGLDLGVLDESDGAVAVVVSAQKNGSTWTVRAKATSTPAVRSGTSNTAPLDARFAIGAERNGNPPSGYGRYDGLLYDLVVYEPASSLADGRVNTLASLVSNRVNLYGILQRRTVDFQDEGLPHGAAFTAHASGLTIDHGDHHPISPYRIPMRDVTGAEASRAEILLTDITPPSLLASELAIEYSRGNDTYSAGTGSDTGVALRVRQAQFDDGYLRIHLRNLSATQLESFRVHVAGYDRRSGDEERYVAIRGPLVLAANSVISLGRDIPVEDLIDIHLWGSAGHGSPTTFLTSAADHAVVHPLSGSVQSRVRGDFMVRGSGVDDSRVQMLHHTRTNPPSGSYSVFRLARASSVPDGFISHIKVVEVAGTPRQIQELQFTLRA